MPDIAASFIKEWNKESSKVVVIRSCCSLFVVCFCYTIL
jgi:hypothetical protein